MDNTKINDWLNDLASKQPTPGGGAVASLATAISAAQLQMVASYTTGPKYAELESEMTKISNDLENLRADALALADADAKAFSAVADAYKLPKDTENQQGQRKSAIQDALAQATVPPIKTAHLAVKLVAIALKLAEHGNPNVISDVAVGASLAKSALESAIVNIEINQKSITNQEIVQNLYAEIENATDAIQMCDGIIESVRDKIGAS